MQKKIKKLALSRETLRGMEEGNLAEVAGLSGTICRTCAYSCGTSAVICCAPRSNQVCTA